MVQGDLRGASGRAAIEQFFASFCSDELRGPPKILHGSDHSFSDVDRKVVSIINLASVAEIADAIGAPVDPLRFRANLYVEGWRAWREFELLDQELAIGSAARLGRSNASCAARRPTLIRRLELATSPSRQR